MDQVSLPMRIALLAVLGFAGLWFVALRPQPASTAPDPAPAAAKPAPKTGSGITGAPAKAKDAVAEANGAAKPAAKPAPESAATKPAANAAAEAKTAEPAAPKAPEEKVSKAAQRVLTDLEAKRSVVLLFWDRANSDDREVRRAVAAVDRRGGKVRVHTAKIDRLGDFEPITRDVPIVTSPTVLVIGRDKRARVVSGLTVTRELDELAGKALAGK